MTEDSDDYEGPLYEQKAGALAFSSALVSCAPQASSLFSLKPPRVNLPGLAIPGTQYVSQQPPRSVALQ